MRTETVDVFFFAFRLGLGRFIQHHVQVVSLRTVLYISNDRHESVHDIVPIPICQFTEHVY